MCLVFSLSQQNFTKKLMATKVIKALYSKHKYEYFVHKLGRLDRFSSRIAIFSFIFVKCSSTLSLKSFISVSEFTTYIITVAKSDITIQYIESKHLKLI